MSWNGEERRNQADHIKLILKEAQVARLQKENEKLKKRVEELVEVLHTVSKGETK